MKRIASISRRYEGGFRHALGFTLVELLVVIGIITLLISILLPALANAYESAKRTRCLSNLHNIGQALVMYANANKGSLPISVDGAQGAYGFDLKESRTAPGSRALGLGLLIESDFIPSASAGGIFHCPSLDTLDSGFNGHCMNLPPTWQPAPYGLGADWFATTTAPNRIICGYSYRDPSYFNTTTTHLRYTSINSDFAVVSDILDPRFGITFTHIKGYNVLRGDMSAAWVDDTSHVIYNQELAAGSCDGWSNPANDETVWGLVQKALP